MTFLLRDPGWCVRKSDIHNKWDDNIQHNNKLRGDEMGYWYLFLEENAPGVISDPLYVYFETKKYLSLKSYCTTDVPEILQ